MKNHWLVIDTGTNAKSDEVLGMLLKSLDGLQIAPLYVEQSSAGAMTSWLIKDEPPTGFSIDQDTELRSTSESRAAVRYLRQSIERSEEHTSELQSLMRTSYAVFCLN